MYDLNRVTDDLRDSYKHRIPNRDKVLLGVVILLIAIYLAL